jgi:hypothetical protein
MQKYSDFFQTLHDEKGPTGYLGRGTHYSVLRAVVFHDGAGRILQRAKFHDFAVIWDEDHDSRVMRPIEKIYRAGLLPRFVIFGERKGSFTAILTDNRYDKVQISELEDSLNKMTQRLEDPWPTRIVNFGDSKNPVIDDDPEKVTLYLSNVVMLWDLGLKAPDIDEASFSPALFTRIDELPFSIRAANSLKNDKIVYVGELVQKTEAEMLRLPDVGRRTISEIQEVLGELGLELGMTVNDWSPRVATRRTHTIGLRDLRTQS